MTSAPAVLMTVTVHLLLVPTQWDPLVVRVIILPAEMAELAIYLQVTRKIRGFVTGRTPDATSGSSHT